MSFRNIYYDKKNNKVHLWHNKGNDRLYKTYDWVPYVYVPVDKKTRVSSIFGDSVVKKKFNNYFEYLNYQKNNEEIFENKVMPEIQFLSEKYYQVSDEELEVPYLKTLSLDIEVHTPEDYHGFPSPKEAECPVVLISLYDLETDKVVVFGEKEYTQTTLEGMDVTYYKYEKEKDLLYNFFEYVHNSGVDVITGWNITANDKMNISGFDFPYLINRSINLFGEENSPHHKLSPINVVRHWESKSGNMNVDIAGVSIIDYMALYKWLSRNNPESYSLEFITNLELGVGKLDYSDYGSLKNLYHQNWNLYTDYNIIDTKKIKELEDKLQYIKQIQGISLVSRCPMKFYDKVTSLIEGLMLTYYRRNEYCAPKFKGGEKEDFLGGHVKQPIQGLHNWVASIDISSSYPTHMVVLNMGIDSYIGKIVSLTEDEITHYTCEKEYPQFTMYNFDTKKTTEFNGEKLKSFNLMLKRGLISISSNGVCFKTSKESVTAYMERHMFEKRKEIKKKMKSSESKEEKSRYNTLQMSYKTLLNSYYGALSVPYFRMFNPHIASAIPACGRHTIKMGEKYVNEILNNPNEELKSVVKELM